MIYIRYKIINILLMVIIDINFIVNYFLVLCMRDKYYCLIGIFGVCLLNNNFCYVFENKENFMC